MTRPWLAAVDWDRPWLAPLQATGLQLISAPDWRTAAAALASRQGLVNHRGLPIGFADQAELPPGEPYEAFISRTGRVPTRDNLHDFFNALVWLTYPLAKAHLNAAQALEIAASSNAGPTPGAIDGAAGSMKASVRGRVRDRATVFDENAALLVTCETAIEAALQQHEWQQALVSQRPAFGTRCEIRLFGHALMEKLVAPYKAITAHVWLLRVAPAFFALPESVRRQEIDLRAGQALASGLLDGPVLALPVLGVPEWWQGQDAAFYDDRSVFRPKRIAIAGRES